LQTEQLISGERIGLQVKLETAFMTSFIRAERDPTLHATVLKSVPLRYSKGADPTLDRPTHVRAGSSLTWFGDRLALIQDDANFLVLIEPDSLQVDAIPLPTGEGGLRQFDDLRENKRFKLDLEACVSVPTPDGDLLLAFGSGSTPYRQKIVMLRESDPTTPVLEEANALYKQLRHHTAFSGSELNIEGAIFRNGWVRLFNRGNGKPQAGCLPVNATCDLMWDELAAYLQGPDKQLVPHLQQICQYHLGTLEELRLTFTDATVTQQNVIFSATAEDSPDASSDGVVAGSVLGILDADARWIELRTLDGSLFTSKVEGVCASRESANRLYLVVDVDDPIRPCELCEVELDGSW